MKNVIGLSLMLAIALVAQTKPKLFDLQPPSAGVVTLVAFVNSVQGNPQLVKVTLDAGLSITQQPDGSYKINSVNFLVPLSWSVENFTAAGGTTLTLAHTPSGNGYPAAVYKNGVLQTLGIDYDVNGAAITFRPSQGFSGDDTAVVRYQF